MPREFFSGQAGAQRLPDLEPGGPRDVSVRIASAVRTALAAGMFRQGEPLPAIGAIAHRYHAGPATVTRALRALAEEGVIVHVRDRRPRPAYYAKGRPS